MAVQPFSVDMKQTAELVLLYHRAPRIFARATGNLINNMAKDTRGQIQKVIPKVMISRNKALIRKATFVDFNRNYSSINGQVAYTYSKELPRFTGWGEQEGTVPNTRRRTIGIRARSGGKEGGKVRKEFKASRNLISPRIINRRKAHIKTAHHLATVLLIWMRRRQRGVPFVIYGHKDITPGIVYFKGTKLKRLQYFRRKDPEKIAWMKKSVEQYFRETNMDEEWRKVLAKVLRPVKQWSMR